MCAPVSLCLFTLDEQWAKYRDLIISQGKYLSGIKPDVVPGSDGAGTVLAVGKHVTRFQPGDIVITWLKEQHLGGSIETMKFGLGGSVDGTLRSIAIYWSFR